VRAETFRVKDSVEGLVTAAAAAWTGACSGAGGGAMAMVLMNGDVFAMGGGWWRNAA